MPDKKIRLFLGIALIAIALFSIIWISCSDSETPLKSTGGEVAALKEVHEALPIVFEAVNFDVYDKSGHRVGDTLYEAEDVTFTIYVDTRMPQTCAAIIRIDGTLEVTVDVEVIR